MIVFFLSAFGGMFVGFLFAAVLIADYGVEQASAVYKEAILKHVAENAKLVDVLHEVEREAIYAYHSLQQDCETIANSSEHFFKKWWYAECELDRAKAENAELRKQCASLYEFSYDENPDGTELNFADSMRDLGVVVDA